MYGYLFHGFIRPDTHSQTAAVNDSCCTHSWKQNQARCTNPWHGHAHWGHPVAIVLPVSDGVDDLEVALEGDDHQTKFICRHPNHRECCSMYEDTYCAVENPVAFVAKAVRKPHSKMNHTEYTSGEIHRRLVGDECMDTAAKLPTSANKNGKNDGIGCDTNAENHHAHRYQYVRWIGLLGQNHRCGRQQNGWV